MAVIFVVFRCGKMCKEPCQPCPVYVLKKRSCGHEVKVKCSENAETAGKCNKKCSLTLPCGHKCTKPCLENCFPCPVKVQARHPDCDHLVKKACGADFDDVVCSAKCDKILTCGHPCLDICGTPCSTSRCQQPVGKVMADCGHKIELLCNEYRAGIVFLVLFLRCMS
jgi:hypothetical protein